MDVQNVGNHLGDGKQTVMYWRGTWVKNQERMERKEKHMVVQMDGDNSVHTPHFPVPVLMFHPRQTKEKHSFEVRINFAAQRLESNKHPRVDFKLH